MATAQRPIPDVFYGWPVPSPSTSPITLAINAANTWLAFGFMLPEAKTLSNVKFRVTAVGGTLGGSDVVAALYSSTTAGQPNASLESKATVTSTPTGAAWVEVTGFTTALSANTQYWIVIKNANGTPATNNFTAASGFGSTGTVPTCMIGGSGRNGWGKWSTTDGSTWVSNVAGSSILRLEFSDGTFSGIPIQAVAVNTVQTVFSTREIGNYGVIPPNVSFNVRGIGMYLSTNAGTPTADPFFKLYTGSTPSLLISTGTFPRGTVTGSGWYYAYFASSVTLSANTIYRAVLAESTQSDTSSNAFRILEYTVENDANSKAILGNFKRTYFDGTNWTETDTAFSPFVLIADTDNEFGSSSGGVPMIGNNSPLLKGLAL